LTLWELFRSKTTENLREAPEHPLERKN